jgi:multisubunit Na+/H+ antiporter MnhG subunit
MILTILGLLIFILFSFIIFKAIKLGRFESYYGKALSADRKSEPFSFWTIIFIYILFWAWIGFMLLKRLNVV